MITSAAFQDRTSRQAPRSRASTSQRRALRSTWSRGHTSCRCCKGNGLVNSTDESARTYLLFIVFKVVECESRESEKKCALEDADPLEQLVIFGRHELAVRILLVPRVKRMEADHLQRERRQPLGCHAVVQDLIEVLCTQQESSLVFFSSVSE